MAHKIMLIIVFIRSFMQARFRHFKTRKQLKKWQKKNFIKFQQQVLLYSEYYTQYRHEALSKYPVLNKKEHMAAFNQINTGKLDREQALSIAICAEDNRDFKGKYGRFSVGLSSGTSGSRGLFVTSDKERAEWAGYIVGKMLPIGMYRHRIAFFLRANNNLYETVNSFFIGFQFFDLIRPLTLHIKNLNKLNPTVLIAPAQVLVALAKLSNDELKIKPLKIISVAEVLENHDREIIERRFNQLVHQIYQCTEGFLGATCSAGNLHLNEDITIIEKQWVDKASGRFVPIVTDIRRSTQPVVRYRLDDILIEDDALCPCGSAMTRLKAIEGRCDDVLQLTSLSGAKQDIYPDFIRNRIIASHKDLQDYQVTQLKNEILQVNIRPYNEQLKDAIIKKLSVLWEEIGVNVPVYEFNSLDDKVSMVKKRRVSRADCG
ncbi:Adenylate-forming enzyme [hydrothermal vent metagenome]|uniref:Adenylate-forming enzyme n=1 Tax=hydrothermal vent metagenome TaxID=652676 RepID=A0A3B0XXG6_9ZZZZ